MTILGIIRCEIGLVTPLAHFKKICEGGGRTKLVREQDCNNFFYHVHAPSIHGSAFHSDNEIVMILVSI